MGVISGRERIETAISSLMAGDSWFYGTESVGKRWVEDSNIPTLCTDGTGVVRYSPDYIESVSFDNTVFCVVHEVVHDVLLHPLRAAEMDMDMDAANIAADIVVNGMLIAAGFKPPPGVIVRPEFDGWSFEAVYEVVYREEGKKRQQGAQQAQAQKAGSQQGSQSGSQSDEGDGSKDPGRCGGFTRPKNESGQDMDKAELAELEREIVARVVMNAQAAKGAGVMPGYLREVIKKVKIPQVHWTSVLERFVTEHARGDYSWEIPDEEYLQRGLYVPSLDSRMLGEIVMAGDASGSIPDDVFQQFTAEGQEVLDRLQPDVLRMIWFADTVETDHEYRPGDVVDPGRRSSGGTLFQPVFDYIREHGYEPACVVVLSDMDSSDTPVDPGYPVLWVSYGYLDAPNFGDVVKIRR